MVSVSSVELKVFKSVGKILVYLILYVTVFSLKYGIAKKLFETDVSGNF